MKSAKEGIKEASYTVVRKSQSEKDEYCEWLKGRIQSVGKPKELIVVAEKICRE